MANAGAWYRVGTVNITKDSRHVVGVDTFWQSDIVAIAVGDEFTVNNQTSYEITGITDDKALILDRDYSGVTSIGKEYAIRRSTSGTTNTRLAGQVIKQFNQKQLFLDDLYRWTNSTQATEDIHDSHGISRDVMTFHHFDTTATAKLKTAQTIETAYEDLNTSISNLSSKANSALNKANYADGLIQRARDTAVEKAESASDDKAIVLVAKQAVLTAKQNVDMAQQQVSTDKKIVGQDRVLANGFKDDSEKARDLSQHYLGQTHALQNGGYYSLLYVSLVANLITYQADIIENARFRMNVTEESNLRYQQLDNLINAYSNHESTATSQQIMTTESLIKIQTTNIEHTLLLSQLAQRIKEIEES